MTISRVIAITGCDSGLGWALAARSAREGLITIAGMFNGVDTKAAEALKELSAVPVPLDVTRSESIDDFKSFVKKLLQENPSYRLYAIVNNAGVMTIGDYEWQTCEMIERTIDVNLLGTTRVISAFLPELRKAALEGSVKPRIINVASHCGVQPLPSFAAYSATKAAVLALSRSLHYELRKYGLRSIAFLPGGFIGETNIASNQKDDIKNMLSHFNEEQISFYGKRVEAVSNHLRPIAAAANSYDSLKQDILIETFMKALTEENPKQQYKVESWRYKYYYALMKLPLPEFIHCWIVKKFLCFPD